MWSQKVENQKQLSFVVGLAKWFEVYEKQEYSTQMTPEIALENKKVDIKL